MTSDADDVLREDETTRALVPSLSIENMLNQRSAVMERYRQVFALLDEASELCRAAHLGIPDIRLYESHRTQHALQDRSTHTKVQQSVDAAGWAYLLSESGLRTFMDAKARKEWDDNIHSAQVPPLSIENVEATFSVMHQSRGDMFERGVIRLFQRLSWDYKTNNPVCFGTRIILNHLLSAYGARQLAHFCLNRSSADEIDDLMRVFRVLDKQPEADHRDGAWRHLTQAIQEGSNTWRNDYLSVKCFKTGTGHVTFHRLDLVDTLNQILAKHYPRALPAPRG